MNKPRHDLGWTIELSFSYADIDGLSSVKNPAGDWEERAVLFWDSSLEETFNPSDWDRGTISWTDAEAGGFIAAKIIHQAYTLIGCKAHIVFGEHYYLDSHFFGCWAVWADHGVNESPIQLGRVKANRPWHEVNHQLTKWMEGRKHDD